jgi:hypothetical protein
MDLSWFTQGLFNVIRRGQCEDLPTWTSFGVALTVTLATMDIVAKSMQRPREVLFHVKRVDIFVFQQGGLVPSPIRTNEWRIKEWRECTRLIVYPSFRVVTIGNFSLINKIVNNKCSSISLSILILKIVIELCNEISVVRLGYCAPTPGNNVIAQPWARVNMMIYSWKTAQ